MKRSSLFLLSGVLFLVLLLAGGGEQPPVGAQLGASFDPHGNYSAATSRCTTCHRPHAQATVQAETACYDCHSGYQTHQGAACSACHDPHARTPNSDLIKPVIAARTVHFAGADYENPQSGVCVVCHTQTRYHGANASATHYENQNCQNCHPHASGFQVNPQGCTVCHGDPPANAGHQAHRQPGIDLNDCTACHQPVRHYTDPGHQNGWVNFKDGQALAGTAVCTTCHGSAAGVAEAKVNWQTQQQLAQCTGCHNSQTPGILHGQAAPAVDAFWTANGHGQGVGLDCQACHNPTAPHFQGVTDARLWEAPAALCARCHANAARAGADVSAHGNQNFALASQPPFNEQCVACHNAHGSANLAAIRSQIRGNSIIFTARAGPNSFDEADSDNRDDLCATCHTRTAHNRQPSNRDQRPHYEGQDCATCHKHETDGDPRTADAFMPGGGCMNCHNQPVDNGDGVPPGGRPAVDAAFASRSHHLQGELTDAKCVVCHDQSTHSDGYVDLRHPDGGAGLRFIQAEDADLTPFCQGCHDGDGSTVTIVSAGAAHDPFGEGSNLLALDKASTHTNSAYHDASEEPFRTSCNDCHAGHGSTNLAIIRQQIGGNPIFFTARTGAFSFDDPDQDDRNDICVTCHVGRARLHQGGDHRAAGDLDLRGSDCTTCHLHDADQTLSTADAFMPSCRGCHGAPPPPASSPAYALNEALTPHLKHAGAEAGHYGLACATCHDRLNPAYSGHVTNPPTFQDVFFDALNPTGSYDPATRTCAGVGCHSNGDPRGGQLVIQRPRWDENSRLTCAGCHGDQFSLITGSHAKHLLTIYSQRGDNAIGCYECHAQTASDGHNDAIANTATHVDFQKQVQIDVSDLWGRTDSASFNSADASCANSLCHSDGAASREQPGTPAFVAPVWGNGASGACGTCHAVTPQALISGAHAAHFDASDQGPGLSDCAACHTPYYDPAHVNGKVDFKDGKTLSQTTACDTCHSPGGAFDGVAEARQKWGTAAPLRCEGCHDSQPSRIKGVAAPDIAGDGVTYGAGVTGHGNAGIACIACHQRSANTVHFDGAANTYRAAADNYLASKWLDALGGYTVPITAGEPYQRANAAQCFVCHSEATVVGMGPGYSNALFTHSTPPPAGYPLAVDRVVTRFRNELAQGFNFGNIPANIHWDHLDMNQVNWDSDGDGVRDSKPSCVTCHDPHGVRSFADGVAHPAMTTADMGIRYGVDAVGAYGEVTRTTYTQRCATCHPAAGIRYYRPVD